MVVIDTRAVVAASEDAAHTEDWLQGRWDSFDYRGYDLAAWNEPEYDED